MADPITMAIGVGKHMYEKSLQDERNKKQHNQQIELMDIQKKNQRELNEHGHKLGYEMWKKTNYPAQVKMMEAAGINPGLMYGSAGQGGQSTSPSGGGASGGNAPTQADTKMQTTMMGLEAQMMEAAVRKTNAEAKKIAEVDTTKVENEIRLLKSQNELEISKKEQTDIQNHLAQMNIDFYETKNLAPDDYGLIKAVQSAGYNLAEAFNWVIDLLPEDKAALIKIFNPAYQWTKHAEK